MRTIATLGPSVRLVVFQFLMKNKFVPSIIQAKRTSSAPSLPRVSGTEVLLSTPDLDVFPLAIRIYQGENYQLVDTWRHPHKTNWDMSFVRFVFCLNEHVKQDELFPDFVAKRDKLESIFSDLISKNLWTTQGHLNLYFEKDGSQSADKVLILGCVGRKPNLEVFRNGRDEYNRGMGPKVLLSTLAQRLNLLGDNIVLADPQLKPIPVA